MPEYSKVEDMPIGATITGIRMSESDDAIKPLAFQVTQVETDSKKKGSSSSTKISIVRCVSRSSSLAEPWWNGRRTNVRTE